MKCIVTGAAGFIGSRLCEDLLAAGHVVTGVDSLTPHYSPVLKQRNLLDFLGHPQCRFCPIDLSKDTFDELLTDAEVLFHLAGMPGLSLGWCDFESYWTCNVLATQKLLEAVVRVDGPLRRLIFASTSAVYGSDDSADENSPTRPCSAYGVTKLAAESLCHAYAELHSVPIVTLRYFSVYGPRQRPDMGFRRFIGALLAKEPILVASNGRRAHGSLYVADCVRATIAAINASPGEVYNVGGSEAVSVRQVLRTLEALAGRSAKVKLERSRLEDQRDALANTAKLRSDLGWEPLTSLEEGLARQWEWQKREFARNQKDGQHVANGEAHTVPR
jgi:nucleoside-diphosphate-sugar epimerase